MTSDQRRQWLVFVVLVGVPLALSTYVLPLRDDRVLIVAVATVGVLGVVSVVRSQLAWSRRRRRRLTAPPPVCNRCGYSRRGNVSGTCPECGTPTGVSG